MKAASALAYYGYSFNNGRELLKRKYLCVISPSDAEVTVTYLFQSGRLIDLAY